MAIIKEFEINCGDIDDKIYVPLTIVAINTNPNGGGMQFVGQEDLKNICRGKNYDYIFCDLIVERSQLESQLLIPLLKRIEEAVNDSDVDLFMSKKRKSHNSLVVRDRNGKISETKFSDIVTKRDKNCKC